MPSAFPEISQSKPVYRPILAMARSQLRETNLLAAEVVEWARNRDMSDSSYRDLQSTGSKVFLSIFFGIPPQCDIISPLLWTTLGHVTHVSLPGGNQHIYSSCSRPSSLSAILVPRRAPAHRARPDPLVGPLRTPRDHRSRGAGASESCTASHHFPQTVQQRASLPNDNRPE